MNPWLSSGLLNSIKRKNQLFKELKLELISAQEYNNYRNRVNALIRLTKRKYFFNIFSNFKQSTKKQWQAINNLSKSNLKDSKLNNIVHNGKIQTDPKEIADTFNNFFADVALNLDNKLPRTHHDPLNFLRGNINRQILLS